MARKSRKKLNNNILIDSNLNKYKAAIYVRLSVEDIRKKISNSLETQKRILLNYIDEKSDFSLFNIYEDINYTGTNFNRPGFASMLNDIVLGKVNCVIIKDFSRLGRNHLETEAFIENTFPSLNVRLISVNDFYDSESISNEDSSKLIISIKNLFNEIFVRDISDKCKSGYKVKQKKGEFCGSFASYGYIKEGKKLIIDKEVVSIVQQIFQWILEGKSDIAIAKELNNQKILPPNKYRFEKGIIKSERAENTKYWYKSAIKRISENPIYTGTTIGNRFQSDFFNGGGRIEVNKENWIVVFNTHDSIIDKNIFESVQEIRSLRKYNYKNKIISSNDNIYKGIIYCAECGCHMIRHKIKRADNIDYYFLCNVYEQVSTNACNKKKILESTVNELIFCMIKKQMELILSVNKIIEKITCRPFYKILDSEINKIERKIQKKKKDISILWENYIDKMLDEQEYINLKNEYNDELIELHKNLKEIYQKKYSEDNTFSIDNISISEFMKFEREKILSLPMIKSLIKKIEIKDDTHIILTSYYRDEFQAVINKTSQEVKISDGL